MDYWWTALLGAATLQAIPYTPLQYLESTGTQYINTGVAPDFANGDEIEIHYYSPSNSGSLGVFGSRQTNLRNGFYVLASGSGIAADSTGYSSFYFSGIGDIQLQVTDLAMIHNNVSTAMPKHVTCTFPMFLFAISNGGSPITQYSGCRVYDWIYRHNGAVAQHLVPALDANNVPCMWDIISNTANYNAGTGTFNYA